jgi:polyhydroxybutyrate depolymerase
LTTLLAAVVLHWSCTSAPPPTREVVAGTDAGDAAAGRTDAVAPGSDSGSPTTDAGSDAASDAGSDADSATTRTAGTVTLSPTIDGTPRTIIVYVPAGTEGPVPLVLNMHGTASTAVAQEAASGMDATADANKFIVAYPQGAIPFLGGFAWNVPGQPLLGGFPVPPGSADDVSFLSHLILLLQQTYGVDPKRIYATGFSGGARMASQLGCDLSATVAAIGPVSGVRCACPSDGGAGRPMPVIAFHGDADVIDPYGGGGQAYWGYSVPTAAQDWATHDGCTAPATISQPLANVTLTEYSPCGGGAQVDLYTLQGQGHDWPTALDANALMWSFFVAHPLP